MQHSKKPYKLPEPLTCDPKEVENGVSMELVKKYIRFHEQRLQRYKYLDAMYKGFHDVFKAPEKPDWKPDNRLVVNFPRYIVDTFMGYSYGIAIKETHKDKSINARLRDFQKLNDLEDHEYELFKRACIFGHAWEYLYQDEEHNTRVTVCTPVDLFTVYDDTMQGKALFSVRYGYHEENGGSTGVAYGEILTREQIEHFDNEKKIEGDANENPYGYIPVVEYRLNDERMGLFECICGMNELYNRTLGEKGNDVDAFAEAYLKILGMPVDEDGVHRIHDDRVINVFGTDDAKEIIVEFLQKPTADGTQENLLDRLETLTFMMSMVANISDKDFGNATSGNALAYKLWSTSNLALTFDRKNRKSIRKRYKIFCSLSTNVPQKDAWQDIEIKMTRNIPRNIQEETETAARAEGIVSKRTQLSLLSYVKDPDEEIAQIRKEEEEEAQRNEERAKRLYGNVASTAGSQTGDQFVQNQAEQVKTDGTEQ